MSDGERPSRRDLAIQRTVLAAERTLLAWTRTSLALVAFGFTIYKFLQYLPPGGIEPEGLQAPRRLSLILIGAGIVFMVLASVQFGRELKIAAPGRPVSLRRLPFVLAVFMALMGILAFLHVMGQGQRP